MGEAGRALNCKASRQSRQAALPARAFEKLTGEGPSAVNQRAARNKDKVQVVPVDRQQLVEFSCDYGSAVAGRAQGGGRHAGPQEHRYAQSGHAYQGGEAGLIQHH